MVVLIVLVVLFTLVILFQALALERRERIIDKLIEENMALEYRLRN